MSLQHFFLEDQVLATQTTDTFELELATDDLKHLRVLRMREGEHFAVIDASSDYFEVELVDFADGLPLVRIAQHLSAPAARPEVTLVQGLAKGDKMETVIRHATELGTAAFWPLACERSVLRLDAKKAPRKVERWQTIAKSAAMQSGQLAIPQVALPTTVKQAAGQLADMDCICICWEEAPQSTTLRLALEETLAEVHDRAPRVAVVVGPEGGLSQQEVDTILDTCPQARLVSLGASILRTETAGIVAPALALYELGLLGNDETRVMPR